MIYLFNYLEGYDDYHYFDDYSIFMVVMIIIVCDDYYFDDDDDDDDDGASVGYAGAGGKGAWPAVFATCALDPCLRCQGSKTKSVFGFCKSQHRRCRESDKSLKRVRQMMELDV